MRRGAIIGFGEVARHGHAPGYLKSSAAKIVAIIDPSAERRALAFESFPQAQMFSALSEVPENLALDFADICTPPSAHKAGILEALSRGLHVLCEKPLVLELAELTRLREEVATRKRALLPVHNWKYAPLVRRMNALLHAGAAGVLQAIEIETRRLQPAPTAQQNWRQDPATAGGGILMDHGWHAIYLARHFFGENPIDLRATLRRLPQSEVEDEAELFLTFPRGSARIFLTWRADRRRNKIILHGDKGRLTLEDDRLLHGEKILEHAPALSVGSHHADWFEAMLPDVLESFRQPERAAVIFEEAALCLAVIRQAYAL